MITQETFEIEIKGYPINIDEIEEFIKKQGIDPVRYFITDANDGKYLLRVSGIKD